MGPVSLVLWIGIQDGKSLSKRIWMEGNFGLKFRKFEWVLLFQKRCLFSCMESKIVDTIRSIFNGSEDNGLDFLDIRVFRVQ